MSFEMKVPPVGESITEVTIAKWLKQDGEAIQPNDVLCELESDKATFELQAEQAGTLQILVAEGETIAIGTAICRIAEGAAAPAPKAEKKGKKAAAAPTAAATAVIDVKVPAVGESITEVTIAKWLKQDGAAILPNEVLCELESDKATFELQSEHAGVLRILVPEGQTIAIGTLICQVAVGAEAELAEVEAAPAAPVANGATNGNGNGYAAGTPSPAAAKILAEKGLQAQQVEGSGVGGRITKEDALNAMPLPNPNPAPKPAAPVAPAAAAPVQPAGERMQRRQKMTPMRKAISKRLVAVKNETAMLTTFQEVDMKPIMDIRAKYKEMFKTKHEVNLGFMSFFIKAASVALLEWPAVNAYIDGDEVVYNDYCDISIAVSAPKGLVVPVIRNAEKLSLAQLEAEVSRLALRARDNKLTIPEMEGGTFSITNGGVFGSMLSTPIINPPQSAILGMHNVVERPVAINGEVVIRPIMYVAMSYDHRIIDGRESVSFVKRIKELLEDPIRLLLNV